ncbi:hypothetical protein D0867_02883 [Hortaea werneckii]|uniref:Rhodopsin domain-containing protein n=2 Tax=Hortaea werneckii TaxID=91943 RepID=A0A3M7A3M9_HORWE|nr:hypothetical protein D0867_02883 [Hortaea werneckii]
MANTKLCRSRGRTWLLPYSVVFAAVSTVLVFIRWGLRLRKQGGGLGLDDAMLLPSWILFICFTFIASYASGQKLVSRHVWDIYPTNFVKLAFTSWLAQMTFAWGTGFVKISVLLFYRRIQSGTFNRPWLFAIYGAIVFTVLSTVVMAVLLAVNCLPTEAYWMVYSFHWHKEYTCRRVVSINAVAGGLSLLSDLYSVVLPCIMLQGLEISRKQKIGLNLVFLVSLTVVAAGSARTWAFFSFAKDSDVSWAGFWLYFWSILEWNLGLMCACAPSLRVLVQRYLQATKSGSRGQTPTQPTTGDSYSTVPSSQQKGIIRHSSFSITSARLSRAHKHRDSTYNQQTDEELLVSPETGISSHVHASGGAKPHPVAEEYDLQLFPTK